MLNFKAKFYFVRRGFLVAGLAFLCQMAFAANVPDASSIMRDLEQQKMRDLALPTFPKQAEQIVELPPLDPSKSVLIKEVVFEGNESLTTLALDLEFADQLNQNFDFTRMKTLPIKSVFSIKNRVCGPKRFCRNRLLKMGS